ncbi:MAG: hypothetical protein HOC82_13655, partial [Bacteroidetes bacterium]|nr:hypothetical protein [Bacteroidota bacterium]
MALCLLFSMYSVGQVRYQTVILPNGKKTKMTLEQLTPKKDNPPPQGEGQKNKIVDTKDALSIVNNQVPKIEYGVAPASSLKSGYTIDPVTPPMIETFAGVFPSDGWTWIDNNADWTHDPIAIGVSPGTFRIRYGEGKLITPPIDYSGLDHGGILSFWQRQYFNVNVEMEVLISTDRQNWDLLYTIPNNGNSWTFSKTKILLDGGYSAPVSLAFRYLNNSGYYKYLELDDIAVTANIFEFTDAVYSPLQKTATLSWEGIRTSGNIYNYIVKRNGVVIASPDFNTHIGSFIDGVLADGMQYCYEITQVLPGGNITSETKCIVTPSCSQVLEAVLGENYAPNQNVWYEFTPQYNLDLKISSCHSNNAIPNVYSYDTYLQVFESCNGILIAENDDMESVACGFNRASSMVTFSAVAGHTYKIFWPYAFTNLEDFPFTFTISYACDTDPPVVTCPPATELMVGFDFDAEYTGSPATAVDVADPNPEITSIPAMPITYSDPGIYEVGWTATDGCGNLSDCVQIITVIPSSIFRIASTQPILESVLDNLNLSAKTSNRIIKAIAELEAVLGDNTLWLEDELQLNTETGGEFFDGLEDAAQLLKLIIQDKKADDEAQETAILVSIELAQISKDIAKLAIDLLEELDFTSDYAKEIAQSRIHLDDGDFQLAIDHYQQAIIKYGLAWDRIARILEDINGVMLPGNIMNQRIFFSDNTVDLNTISMNQNYPNPFVYGTTIEYSIPQETKVMIFVFNT